MLRHVLAQAAPRCLGLQAMQEAPGRGRAAAVKAVLTPSPLGARSPKKAKTPPLGASGEPGAPKPKKQKKAKAKGSRSAAALLSLATSHYVAALCSISGSWRRGGSMPNALA